MPFEHLRLRHLLRSADLERVLATAISITESLLAIRVRNVEETKLVGHPSLSEQ
jgi:hypothetical protein